MHPALAGLLRPLPARSGAGQSQTRGLKQVLSLLGPDNRGPRPFPLTNANLRLSKI